MECAEVLELQRKSYKIEADLIGTDEIPPLKETFEQLQDCGETFIGYYMEGRLAGALSFKKEGKVIDIHRMMVHPDFFRRGIAKKLIFQLEQIGYSEMLVSTGADNKPATKLYEKLGFKRQNDSVVGNGLVLAHFKKRQG
ncbi:MULTISPECIES: GNAT family N-acetyltransferase [unclassified Bacillus (in: firmicutes)]|uniref:GNAT family N-acetyltransferase n=1 Tax=unclassified Bacillus (in: firmicutes) TaxID=185979 RepID=UPI001BE89A56|nr:MULTISPECIES: GNAT family N-acetyltransferase [unclassified Bacillus (in: firmicutes)]MBT2637736.1 GNAT family N-acetyltransferase [Bacillus sp. ISL-39]MBT2640948.1 GNAT family N-acetyltransferase [Bacillus sp. ISL-41]MBT2661900.1 GNAT family N-acetyltransferase [Bacillus sp. ISL-45]